MRRRNPLTGTARPLVYLAGPIAGCTDEEAHGWRDAARACLKAYGADVLDPMIRDYRGKEAGNECEIVESDLRDIQKCSHVLVNAARPSWGTAMEIMWAATAGVLLGREIKIVVFGAGQRPSPWLVYHATCVDTLSHALQEIGVPVLTCARALPPKYAP